MKNACLIKTMFGIFLFCCFYNVSNAQDTAAAKADLQNGSALYTQGRYAEAIGYFAGSIKQVPTAYGYFFLGASYCNVGNYQQAKINVTVALNLNPPLSRQRKNDAQHILVFIDSILNSPKPPVVVQETSDGGASSDPITSVPQVNIHLPSVGENPLADKYIHVSTHVLSESLQCSQDNFTVRSTYNCDLENNGESDNADFWWNTTNYIGIFTPENGAKFFLMWSCPNCYDTLTRQALINYDERELMTTDKIPLQQLRPGELIAYVTRNNLYGILKIEKIIYNGQDPSLLISFRTYK
jgi:tetratricopeptide (TPR) repeat protein